MRRPQLLICDLDNTLYEYEPCHRIAMNRSLEFLAQGLGRSLQAVEHSYNQARLLVKARLGATAASHSRLLYFEQLILLEKAGFRPDLVLTAERLYWSNFIGRMQLQPGAEEFLLSLRKANCRIAIVTDLTSEIQLRKVVRLGLQTLVDCVFTSEFLGGDKPDNGYLQILFSTLEIQPAAIWCVGDSDNDFIDVSLGRDFNGYVGNFNIRDHTFVDLAHILYNSHQD